jgi:hypothetical protein
MLLDKGGGGGAMVTMMFLWGAWCRLSLSLLILINKKCIQITSPAWICPKSFQSVLRQSMASNFPSNTVHNDPCQ